MFSLSCSGFEADRRDLKNVPAFVQASFLFQKCFHPPSLPHQTPFEIWLEMFEDVCLALLLLLALLVWQLQTSLFWPIDLWDERLPLVMMFWRSEWLTGILNLNNNAAWKEWFRFKFDKTTSLALLWHREPVLDLSQFLHVWPQNNIHISVWPSVSSMMCVLDRSRTFFHTFKNKHQKQINVVIEKNNQVKGWNLPLNQTAEI